MDFGLLLLVGASVRDMTESASGSGIRSTGIDFFGDLDCRGKILTPSDDFDLEPTTLCLLKIAKEIECQGFVYGSGPENHRAALRYWEEKGLLLGNGTETLAHARDPYILRKVLKEIDIKMPEFHSPDRIPTDGFRLLKPLFGGGGHGIVRLPEEEAAIRGILSELDEPERYIIQKEQDGIPASITFLADGHNARLVGSSYQIIQKRSGRNPFRYIGNIVPLIAPNNTFWNDMKRMASHLTAAFGLKGLNTLDFVLCDDLLVLELNPRWSGSVELIEAWLGRRLLPDHIRACKGELPERDYREDMLSVRPRCFYGKQIIYADTSFTVRNYEEDWQPIYKSGIRDIPKPGCQIRKDNPVCTVLAEGATKKECVLNLQEKTRRVREFYENNGKGVRL